MNNIKNLIKSIIENYYINEIRYGSSNFEIKIEPYRNNDFRYIFQTPKGNKYDVYFLKEIINAYSAIIGDKFLADYLKDGSRDYNFIDVEFSVSNKDNHTEKISDIEFTKKTYNFEQKDVYRGVIDSVKKYANINKDSDIFTINKDPGENELIDDVNQRLRIYIDIFKNVFSNTYTLFEGNSFLYKETYYYFVNNNLLK
jgi:hypothetical protein